jgi:hypothetical protein
VQGRYLMGIDNSGGSFFFCLEPFDYEIVQYNV